MSSPRYYVVQISEAQRLVLVAALANSPAAMSPNAEWRAKSRQLMMHLDRLPNYEELRPDCLHDITG